MITELDLERFQGFEIPQSIQLNSLTLIYGPNSGEGGSTPSSFKKVVRTKMGLRRLAPVELERLCGFPDGWTNPPGLKSEISDGRRAFFMGNVVVIGLVEIIGKARADDHKSLGRPKK